MLLRRYDEWPMLPRIEKTTRENSRDLLFCALHISLRDYLVYNFNNFPRPLHPPTANNITNYIPLKWIVLFAHADWLARRHSRPQSLRSFWPAAGIECSGSNHYERTKEITRILVIRLTAHLHLWRMPEMVAPRALDSCRRPEGS